MKLLLILICSFTLNTVLYSNDFAGTPKIYAVIIGIADYKDAGIPNLKYSEKDAEAFYDFLKSPYAGSVPEENIVLLIGPNATRGNVIRSMVDISKRSTKEDMLIFYFSGHGEADQGDNSGYLLSYDAETDNAPATALSMDEIKTRIDKCRAKLKVSYVDACHAGLFKASDRKGSLEADNEIIASAFMESVSKADDGNVAFLASSARQQSQESDKLSNGVFTYYLLKGLKGDADKMQKEAKGYNDGLVTVGEMATYLTENIPAATKYNQKPTINGTYDEDFPLSVLKTNVTIQKEIAKRPEKKEPEKVNAATKTDNTAKETATLDMPPGKCKEQNYSYGELNFINNYSEDVLLYFYYNGNFGSAQKPNLLLAKGEKINMGRVGVGRDDKIISADIKFYIRTADESKPVKYGSVTLNVESCKIKTYILSTKNLYLSIKGEIGN